MKRITYLSQPIKEFSTEDLINLCVQASLRNETLDVCGYLHYSGSQFFQYLEGGSDMVDQLFNEISSDPRHKIIKKVDLDDSSSMMFPDWRMKFIPQKSITSCHLEDLLSQIYSHLNDPSINENILREEINQLSNKLAKEARQIDEKYSVNQVNSN